MVKNTKGGSSHKKTARKNESDNKIIKVNLNVNFTKDNILVAIDKNIGNCFTAKLLHYGGTSDEYNRDDLKIMHQRGKKGKSNFDHSHSRIALVSLINGISLSSKCIGVVEEFIEIDHLNAYLSNNLITQEVYDKLNMKFSITTENKNNNNEDLGFEFDRSKNEEDEDDDKVKKPVKKVIKIEEKDKERELNIEEI
jgi:hypothetical protein